MGLVSTVLIILSIFDKTNVLLVFTHNKSVNLVCGDAYLDTATHVLFVNQESKEHILKFENYD